MIELYNKNIGGFIFFWCIYLVLGILISYLISDKGTESLKELVNNKKWEATLLILTIFFWPLWFVKIIVFNPLRSVIKEINQKFS